MLFGVTNLHIDAIQASCQTMNPSCPRALDVFAPKPNIFGITFGRPQVVKNSCVYGMPQ